MTRTLLALAAVSLATPAAAGDLVGAVRYEGAPVVAAPIPATKDQQTCGAQVPDESLLVGAGGALRNAVVRLTAPVEGVTPAPAKLTLDQQRCRFVPRVQAAPPGSAVEVVNGDPILHSAHGWSGKRTAFNVATPTQGQRETKTLSKPGLVRVGCDVHGWMAAYIWVSDAPAAVTGADGAFALRGLPAGTYEVAVWHERLGERIARATVPAQGEARLDFTLGR